MYVDLPFVIASVWQHTVKSGQNVNQPFAVPTANFGCAPTCETKFVECITNGCPIDRSVTDSGPFVCITIEAFDVYLDDPFFQGSNPILRLAILESGCDIEECANPRTVTGVDEGGVSLCCLLRFTVVVVEHSIPYIFDQDFYTKLRGKW